MEPSCREPSKCVPATILANTVESKSYSVFALPCPREKLEGFRSRVEENTSLDMPCSEKGSTDLSLALHGEVGWSHAPDGVCAESVHDVGLS